MRPAVCLTDTIGVHRHVVLAFITSVILVAPEASDVLLSSGMADFAKTGLRLTSTLRLHRVMTVSAAIIRRQLGVLPPIARQQVTERLRVLFAIQPS